jgi:hypothetical protein
MPESERSLNSREERRRPLPASLELILVGNQLIPLPLPANVHGLKSQLGLKISWKKQNKSFEKRKSRGRSWGKLEVWRGDGLLYMMLE